MSQRKENSSGLCIFLGMPTLTYMRPRLSSLRSINDTDFGNVVLSRIPFLGIYS